MDEFRFDTRAVQPLTESSNPHENALRDLEARLAALEDGSRPSVSSVTTQSDPSPSARIARQVLSYEQEGAGSGSRSDPGPLGAGSGSRSDPGPLGAGSGSRSDPGEDGEPDTSSRHTSPNSHHLEAAWALAFRSGAAAIDAIARLLRPGDRVVAHDEVSAQTFTALGVLEEFGVIVEYRDLADPSQWRFRHTSLVWCETPSTATLKVVNLASVSRRAHEAGALVLADTTLVSPFVTRPLGYGVDLVLHAGAGALTGENNLEFGAIAGRNPEVLERLRLQRTLSGTQPGMLEVQVASAGLRSLSVRIERQSMTALELAKRLKVTTGVRDVYYPGLESHRGYVIAARQMISPAGSPAFGPVLSVRLEREIQSGLFTASEPGGAISALTQFPAKLVRLSVGLEDIEDLWADLQRAMQSEIAPVLAATIPEPVLEPALEVVPEPTPEPVLEIAQSFEPAKGDPAGALNAAELERYARLREWRDTEATKLEVSRLVVASNAILSAIASANPESLETLGAIKGMGPERLRKYADAMLNALKKPVQVIVQSEPVLEVPAKSAAVPVLTSSEPRRRRRRTPRKKETA
jgi:cystathionine beta-lyase/cystathionine gamma-synthase